jgi:hypothetical protein
VAGDASDGVDGVGDCRLVSCRLAAREAWVLLAAKLVGEKLAPRDGLSLALFGLASPAALVEMGVRPAPSVCRPLLPPQLVSGDLVLVLRPALNVGFAVLVRDGSRERSGVGEVIDRRTTSERSGAGSDGEGTRFRGGQVWYGRRGAPSCAWTSSTK